MRLWNWNSFFWKFWSCKISSSVHAKDVTRSQTANFYFCAFFKICGVETKTLKNIFSSPYVGGEAEILCNNGVFHESTYKIDVKTVHQVRLCGQIWKYHCIFVSAPTIKFCRNLSKIFETSIFQKNVLMFETKISQISWLWCGDITAPCVKSACDFGIEIYFSENFAVEKCHHQCMRKVLRVAKLIIFDFVHFRQLFEKMLFLKNEI